MTRFPYSEDYKVAEYVASLKGAVRKRLESAVLELGGEISEVARGQAPHRSGRLASSITFRMVSKPTRVMGSVGVSGALGVKYGHAVEAGFTGAEKVAQYYRTIKQAFGRPIKPTEIKIKAHTRNVSIAAHPFLRDTLAAAQPRIIERLTTAIDGAGR